MTLLQLALVLCLFPLVLESKPGGDDGRGMRRGKCNYAVQWLKDANDGHTVAKTYVGIEGVCTPFKAVGLPGRWDDEYLQYSWEGRCMGKNDEGNDQFEVSIYDDLRCGEDGGMLRETYLFTDKDEMERYDNGWRDSDWYVFWNNHAPLGVGGFGDVIEKHQVRCSDDSSSYSPSADDNDDDGDFDKCYIKILQYDAEVTEGVDDDVEERDIAMDMYNARNIRGQYRIHDECEKVYGAPDPDGEGGYISSENYWTEFTCVFDYEREDYAGLRMRWDPTEMTCRNDRFAVSTDIRFEDNSWKDKRCGWVENELMIPEGDYRYENCITFIDCPEENEMTGMDTTKERGTTTDKKGSTRPDYTSDDDDDDDDVSTTME